MKFIMWLYELYAKMTKKKKEKPTPEPVEEPVVDTDGTMETLLKPISESRGGRACVIIQAQIRGIKMLMINGVEDVYEYRPGFANGNRIHVFLNLMGPSYPNGSVIRVLTGDGRWIAGVWKNTSERENIILK